MDYADSSLLSPGTLVDQYVITKVLGHGGFGITYLVRDEALEKDFALKEFFPQGLVRREGTSIHFVSKSNGESDYRWARGKFFEEARLLAQFKHESIVHVWRAFEANQSAYMLLDYLEGETLETWLKGRAGPPTQDELDRIALPLLGALELVHRNRALHLDVSPDNVIIRASDGVPVLIDFGAARNDAKQHSQLMSALIFKGGYSAPEQYTSNANKYGPWTDLYGFAAILHRAITGHRPMEATSRYIDDEVPAATLAGKDRYRPEFLAAIDWALKLSPPDRPQSVATFRERLLEAGRAPVPAAAIVAAPLPELAVPPTALLRARAASRPVVWAGAGFATLLAAGVATVAMVAQSPKQPTLIQPAPSRTAAVEVPKPAPPPPAAAVPAPKAPEVPRAEPPKATNLAAGDTFRDCPTCPEMVVVPAGEYIMGASKVDIDSGMAAANEGPQRKVSIKQRFGVGRFEVTRDEFEAFSKATGYDSGDKCHTFEGNMPDVRSGRSVRNPGYPQAGTHPAVCVSWEDTQAYLAWLSSATGKPYRLLSEAEWEYAARAGTTGRTYFGTNPADLCAFANGADQAAKAGGLPANWDYVGCSDGHLYTAPVGSFRPNGFGVSDMLGNAWEWTGDCYAEDNRDAPVKASVPLASACPSHSARGGSWFGTAKLLTATTRAGAPNTARFDDVGFRVARAIEP